MADRDRLEMKYDQLKDRIASEGKAAIAFSGGVDSVFLLYAAKEALGDGRGCFPGPALWVRKLFRRRVRVSTADYLQFPAVP